jgi:hypothetical protein
MAENADDSVGDNEKAQAGAESQKSQAMTGNTTSNLPMVVAPKLGAGDEEVDDAPEEAAADTAAPAAAAHSSRFMMLAASVAFAAAFGSFVGSVSGSGLAHFLYPAAAAPAAGATASADATREMKLQLTELSTIKANLDNTSRATTSQLAKLSDRLDRLDQRVASTSPTTETTGSIAPPAAAPVPPAPPTAPKLSDRILPDWVVQDVQDGRALVQSRYGGMFDVGEGSTLPGVGRVDQIKRQDGQWIVLTARGVITSGR